jgi:hypothetical protein
LKKHGYGGRVVIISRESYLPIDRPKLSKSLKIDAARIALRPIEDLNSLNIEMKLGTVYLNLI